jgi:subtilisin family serine protease
MSRFLLIPKDEEEIPDVLAGGDLSLAPASRARKIESLRAIRRSQAGRDTRLNGGSLRRIADVKVVASPQRHTPVTGITIFEGSLNDAQRIQEAVPGQELVEDFVLDLIAPVPAPVDGDATGGGRAGGAGIVPSDLDLWHLDAIGLLKARPGAFGLSGAGAIVAVMDTGVAEHEELRGRIVDNIVFDVDTWKATSTAPADTDTIFRGHGTHVAGIIAGTNVGVAPGAKILSYTMLPNTRGTLSHFVFAIEHLLTRPEVQIINMSAGKPGQVSRMRYLAQIAQRLDTLFVVSVGNEGANTSRSPGNYPEVLSVAASDRTGKLWAGGGMGTVLWGGQSRVVPDIVAPGVEVWSLLPGEGYQMLTGTSQATPIVSGIAALLIEKWPDITRPELIGEFLEAVDVLGLPPPLEGLGRVRLPDRLLSPPPGADGVA